MSTEIFILAGGKSRRMGRDKGLISVKGKPIIQYLIDSLTALNLPISIISNETAYMQFGFPVYPDLILDKGPLGGLYTSLSHSESTYNLLLSCDTPLVSHDLLASLVGHSHHNFDAVVPQFAGKSHPLIGGYQTAILEQVSGLLGKNQLRMTDLLTQIKTHYLDVSEWPEEQFLNLNRPEDLEEFKKGLN